MTSNKSIIFATILGAIITAAVPLYIYLDNSSKDFPEESAAIESVKEKEGEKEKENETQPQPSINFEMVFVTPVDTKILSSFFIEMSNIGSASAKNFKINIDFGESKAEECEILPSGIIENGGDYESSIIDISIFELDKKQSLYVVCSVNSPLFKSITVNGGNIKYAKQFTFEDYKEMLDGKSVSFYESLLRGMLIVIAVICSIFLFFFMIYCLSKLNWT